MLGVQQQQEEAAERQRAILARMLNTKPAPSYGVGQQSSTAQPTSQNGGGDYLNLIKKGKDAYDLYQSGDGGGYGGYLAAATTFKNFMDWSFDKDATGGGIGRTNIHLLEDAWQPFKNAISDGSDIAGNMLSDVGGFFSDLF